MRAIFFTILLVIFSLNLFAKKDPEIELGEIELMNKTVKIKIPTNFKYLDKSQYSKFYLSETEPKIMYTNDDRSIHIGFFANNIQADERTLPAVTRIMEKALQSTHPKAKWKNTGIQEVNGGKVGFVEYQNKKPEKFYELVFFTNFRGQILSCIFHAPKKGYKPWKNLSYQMMKSLTLIKENNK